MAPAYRCITATATAPIAKVAVSSPRRTGRTTSDGTRPPLPLFAGFAGGGQPRRPPHEQSAGACEKQSELHERVEPERRQPQQPRRGTTVLEPVPQHVPARLAVEPHDGHPGLVRDRAPAGDSGN